MFVILALYGIGTYQMQTILIILALVYIFNNFMQYILIVDVEEGLLSNKIKLNEVY